MTKEEKLLKALGFSKKEEKPKKKDYYAIAKLYNIKTTHDLALFKIKQQSRIIIDFIDKDGQNLPNIQKALILERMIATLRTNCLKLIDKNQNIEDVLDEEESHIISLQSYKEKEEK